MAVKEFSINKTPLQSNMEELSEIGKFGETGVNRLALSKEYKEGIELLKSWKDEADLETRVDNFGNLIGRF